MLDKIKTYFYYNWVQCVPLFLCLVFAFGFLFAEFCVKDSTNLSFYSSSSKAIVERSCVYSNTLYYVVYDEYGTNTLPYHVEMTASNVPMIHIRNAVISVLNSNRVQIGGDFRGISIKDGGFDETSDIFYISKALSIINNP